MPRKPPTTQLDRNIFVALFIGALLLLGLAADAQQTSAVRVPATGKSVRSSKTSPIPVFLPPVVYASGLGGGTGWGPFFALADVNNDGKLDVVMAGYNVLGVLLGNGNGTFQSPITQEPDLTIVYSLAVADVNGDGIPDVIEGNPFVPSLNYNSGVSVMLGNGDGTFQNPMSFAVSGSDPVSIAVADLNGDGKPDIVEVSYFGIYGSSISVLLGNGDGTFQPQVTYNPQSASVAWVVIADVNGDGKPDLVIANTCGMHYNCYPSGEGSVSVLLGNGDGTFQPAVPYDSGGSGATVVPWPGMNQLAVADVNGDGKPDIAVVNSGSGTVDVLLGNGDGTFQTAVGYSTTGTGPDSVAIKDVNGDGKPDLVVINMCSGAVVGIFCSGEAAMNVLLGNGDGTFQPPLTYPLPGPSGTPAFGIAVTDLSGAGMPDVVTELDGINVLINATSPAVTTTILTSSLNPSTYGQSVTLTATVTNTSSVPPTGTVLFQWNNLGQTLTLGTATLNSSGVATLTISNFNADTFPIVAIYKGDANNLGSTSAVFNQVVQQATSSATLTSSPNPSNLGQAVTFTAEITSPTVLVKGPVTFTAGNTTLGTVELGGGRARLTTTALPAGSNVVTVTYQGFSDIKGSSASVTQVVQGGGSGSQE
jgi:hypothetical protein